MEVLIFMTKEQKLQYWKSVIDKCYSTGEPVITWCHDNGINESCFYKWRRAVYPNFSRYANADSSDRQLFTPVVIKESKELSITVNGVNLSFDDSLLERVIGALK